MSDTWTKIVKEALERRKEHIDITLLRKSPNEIIEIIKAAIEKPSRLRIGLFRLPAVIDKVGLSKSTIYKMIAAGTFPPPIKLGKRASGWWEDEIDAWLVSRSTSPASPPSPV